MAGWTVQCHCRTHDRPFTCKDIVDNGAIKAAFAAYGNATERSLTANTDYQFFLSFAQVRKKPHFLKSNNLIILLQQFCLTPSLEELKERIKSDKHLLSQGSLQFGALLANILLSPWILDESTQKSVPSGRRTFLAFKLTSRPFINNFANIPCSTFSK